MVLPLILLGAAIAAGGFGVKQGFDAVADSNEATDLRESASRVYDNAAAELNWQREKTRDELAKLGRLKLETWHTQLSRFLDLYGQIKNVKLEGQASTEQLGQINPLRFSQSDLVDMARIAKQATEAVAGGVGAIGAGALAGVAAYGGAGMFATASTGTAISALSGVAATNATLAWFGGGSLAAGGMGMAGGMMVLGGIVTGPVLAVGGMVWAAKAREDLAQAKSDYAQAKRAVDEMRNIAALAAGIEKVAGEFHWLIQSLANRMNTVLDLLENIIHVTGIDYQDYTQSQKGTVYAAVQFAQALKIVLETPILTKDGALTTNYHKALGEGRKALQKA